MVLFWSFLKLHSLSPHLLLWYRKQKVGHSAKILHKKVNEFFKESLEDAQVRTIVGFTQHILLTDKAIQSVR